MRSRRRLKALLISLACFDSPRLQKHHHLLFFNSWDFLRAKNCAKVTSSWLLLPEVDFLGGVIVWKQEVCCYSIANTSFPPTDQLLKGLVDYLFWYLHAVLTKCYASKVKINTITNVSKGLVKIKRWTPSTWQCSTFLNAWFSMWWQEDNQNLHAVKKKTQTKKTNSQPSVVC